MITEKDWLNGDGEFLFGKHRGEVADEVVKTDPNYLRWIVDSVEDCSPEDREILSALLAMRKR